MDDDISLILPGQSVPDDFSIESMPSVVWLRNPKTGVIHKFLRPRDDDSIARCWGERYTPSSEEAARAQAIELARLQGRPLPAWASDEDKAIEKLSAKIPEADAREDDAMLLGRKAPRKSQGG